jgi:hypothetical protein
MKTLSAITMALAVLLMVPAALAADEVILKHGESGIADIVKTTEDSVTFKYIIKDGPTAEMTLRANQLDPNNFYMLRNKYMEKTVDNHMGLAKFCVENELFSRARIQANLAREIDEEKVNLILDDAKVKEAIAESLLKYVARELKAGNMAEAEKWLHVLLTRAPETKAAEIARQNLDKVEEAREAKQAKEAKARQEAIEAEDDAAAKEQAEKREKALAPIRKHLDAGEKMAGAALREKNSSNQKKALEAAGRHFEAAVAQVQSLRKKVGEHAELDQLEQECRNNAVKCYLDAGNIDLSKSSFNNATKWAQRAKAVDPSNSSITDFENRVAMAAAMSGRWGRR